MKGAGHRRILPRHQYSVGSEAYAHHLLLGQKHGSIIQVYVYSKTVIASAQMKVEPRGMKDMCYEDP